MFLDQRQNSAKILGYQNQTLAFQFKLWKPQVICNVFSQFGNYKRQPRCESFKTFVSKSMLFGVEITLPLINKTYTQISFTSKVLPSFDFLLAKKAVLKYQLQYLQYYLLTYSFMPNIINPFRSKLWAIIPKSSFLV